MAQVDEERCFASQCNCSCTISIILRNHQKPKPVAPGPPPPPPRHLSSNNEEDNEFRGSSKSDGISRPRDVGRNGEDTVEEIVEDDE